jgi:hypothetical protein
MADENSYQELANHIDACPQCRQAKKRVNDFCEVGVALFFAWDPEPESCSPRDCSPEEYERMKNDPVNRARTEN